MDARHHIHPGVINTKPGEPAATFKQNKGFTRMISVPPSRSETPPAPGAVGTPDLAPPQPRFSEVAHPAAPPPVRPSPVRGRANPRRAARHLLFCMVGRGSGVPRGSPGAVCGNETRVSRGQRAPRGISRPGRGLGGRGPRGETRVGGGVGERPLAWKPGALSSPAAWGLAHLRASTPGGPLGQSRRSALAERGTAPRSPPSLRPFPSRRNFFSAPRG